MTTHSPDPRSKNVWFNAGSVSSYLSGYGHALSQALATVDPEAVDRVVQVMGSVATDAGTLFTAGNGGSAAIADHLTCDFSKGTRRDGCPSLHTQALSSNVALASAISNDLGYEYVFSEQVSMFAKPGDAVVLISSSGNSPNILEAIRVAKECGVPAVAITGFDGGAAREQADHCIHVDYRNYGIVEDAHQAVMHAMAQYFYITRGGAA